MEILFFNAIATELTGEAFAASWIALDVFNGLDDSYVTNNIDDPQNFGIIICENLLPEKQWIKDNIVPGWQNMKITKNPKKMRQEFWQILNYFQPQQIWTDSLFPIKSHFMWQVIQENYDPENPTMIPYPIFDLQNFVDKKVDRITILREIVAESEGNASGFLELCQQKILFKPNNPIISCLAGMTLFSYLLDKRKIQLFI